jgi:hypothetical protein
MDERKHIGFRPERTAFDKLEESLASTWLEKNRLFSDWTQMVLKNPSHPERPITKRDSQVAATVIQWLGTNNGFHFLLQALEKGGYKIVENDKDKK